MLQELREIEELRVEANGCFERQDLKTIRLIISKLKKYLCFDEAYALKTRLTGEVHYLLGKPDQARERFYRVLNDIWGDETTLARLRLFNSECSPSCRLFEVTVRAGVAGGSYLSFFSPDHVVTFLAVAETDFEALKFIHELCQIAPGEAPIVVMIRSSEGRPPQADRRGVYHCSVFSLYKQPKNKQPLIRGFRAGKEGLHPLHRTSNHS